MEGRTMDEDRLSLSQVAAQVGVTPATLNVPPPVPWSMSLFQVQFSFRTVCTSPHVSKGGTLTLDVPPLLTCGLAHFGTRINQNSDPYHLRSSAAKFLFWVGKPRHIRKSTSNRENHVISGKLVFPFVCRFANVRQRSVKVGGSGYLKTVHETQS